MKNNDKRHFIQNANLFKVITILSLPIIFNNVVIALYQIIDSFFSESLGSQGLAAVSFVSPIVDVIFAIAVSLSIASTTLAARAIGNKNNKEARKSVGQILFITFITSVLITVIGFIFSFELMKLLSAREEFIELASTYFKLNLLLLPFKFIGDIYFSYKAARGETFHTMIISLISMISKILFSLLLVNYLDLGVYGLVLASGISYIVVLLFGVYDMFLKKHEFKISFKDMRLNMDFVKPFFILLIPLLFEKIFFSFSHVLMNILISDYSPEVIAAYGLSNRINTLYFAIPNALGSAIIIIIAQNLAVNNQKRVTSAIFKTTIFSFILSTIPLALVYIFLEDVVSLFTSNPEIIRHTMEGMIMFSHTIYAWTLMQVGMGVFYAAGYSSIPIIVSFSRLFVFRFPVLYLLNKTNLGTYSIWWAMLVSNNMGGVVAIVLLFIVKWRTPPKYLQQQDLSN